jgi:hypothetical protein
MTHKRVSELYIWELKLFIILIHLKINKINCQNKKINKINVIVNYYGLLKKLNEGKIS